MLYGGCQGKHWTAWLGRAVRGATRFSLLGALGLIFALWDDGITSLFLVVLLPAHLLATLAIADAVPDGLRSHVWSAARVALLFPALLGCR